MPRHRSNPLALAVLITLHERPMHPYEIASTLRERNKHESVRLNYGSLYAVVPSLERRGLIAPRETVREGRLPERTVYGLTEKGELEAHDWLTDLIAVPANDFPAFGAGLSFLPALPPEDVAALLRDRARQIEVQLSKFGAEREVNDKAQIPRLVWVEDEFRSVMRESELGYIRRLISDIESGSLKGIEWWRMIHQARDEADRADSPMAEEVARESSA